MQQKFLTMSREICLRNLKYINIVLSVTSALIFFSYLTEFKEKGVLLFLYADLVLICVFIFFMGKKYTWFVDNAPTLIIIVHTLTIVLFHTSYHYEFGLDTGRIERH